MVSQSQSVLEYRMVFPDNGVVFDDGAEAERYELWMAQELYEEMDKPHEITITVQPGNTLEGS